ncbi:hypothetical protein V8F20_010317 [Naviculisporaceae sp. PSN 640]
MEIALAAGTLKAAYQLLIVGIKVEQVPNAVRRCIELVRTCHRDLEDLIKLRNESLPMLESKPAILQRINAIIENAHNGLLEVARLVEKLRPEAHDGSSPLMGRLEWIFIDSREFSSQEPLISRQHSSVIAELNFLRQLILLAPLINKSGSDGNTDGGQGSTKKRSAIAWDNVGLLDEMMGGRKEPKPQTPVPPTASVSAHAPAYAPAHSSPSSNFTTPQSVPAHRVASPTPTLADPPPPYSSPVPSSNPTFPTTFPPSSTSANPLVYNVAVPTPPAPVTIPTSSLAPEKSKPSAESLNIKKTTTFDPDGISFLFGDLKVTPKPAAVSTTAQAQQPGASTSSGGMPGPPLSWQSPVPTSSASSVQPKPLQALSGQFSSTHDINSPSTYQQTQAQQMEPLPDQQAQNQPATALPTQAPPLPSKQEPVFMVKPLSTIPQELIHRHDGVQSPPQNPLFSPVLGPVPPSIPQPPPTATAAVQPTPQPVWGNHVQETQVPATDARPDCCSSCGSARTSLSGVPTARPSTSSSFNNSQPFEAFAHGPAPSQTLNPTDHQDYKHNPGQLRAPSPARPQSWVHPASHTNPWYASGTTPSSPPSISTPPINTATTYSGTYTPSQTEEAHVSRNTRARRAVSSLDLTQPFTNQPTGATAQGHGRGLFPQASVANFHGAPSGHTVPPIHRHSTPQPTISHQTAHVPQEIPHPPSQLHPVSSGGFGPRAPAGGGQNSYLNPSVQTFATIREHWKPETLTAIQQMNPVQHGGEVPTGYPNQPSQPSYPGSFVQSQYRPAGAVAVSDHVDAVPRVHDISIAELYGSVVPEAGNRTSGWPQHYDGKPNEGMIHAEIHELPSVKFAPDPVELE